MTEELDQPLGSRSRAKYLLWLALVIVAGLASRSKMLELPPFIAKYAGDALWAMMVFVALAIVLPRRSTAAIATLAIITSCAVEFSQLYHAPWIDNIRHTTPGHLALGDTFAWRDMAAYLVGIAVAGVIEWIIQSRRSSNHLGRM